VRIIVYAALLGALVTCLLARRAARRLSPPLAAVTLSLSAVLCATAWVWNLALLAGTLIGRLDYLARAGHWSEPALVTHDPVPVLNATVAGVLVGIAAAGLSWCAQRTGRELWRAWAVARQCAATEGGVVVVDDPAPRAVALPGLRGRVVVTTSMVRALSAPERRVLLAHEQAHLRYQHGLFRLAVRLAAAVLPVLRPLVGDCDYQLERWADEAAARQVGDRKLAAQSVARAALAIARGGRGPHAALAFAERNVTRRVQALLAEPPRSDLRRLALPLVVLAVTTAFSVEAGRDLDALFELAQRLHTG
jgi:Zn-dependent protease with chaperone function